MFDTTGWNVKGRLEGRKSKKICYLAIEIFCTEIMKTQFRVVGEE